MFKDISTSHLSVDIMNRNNHNLFLILHIILTQYFYYILVSLKIAAKMYFLVLGLQCDTTLNKNQFK